MDNYLKIPSCQQRRHISKLRCSDHSLEIEKGRHKKGNTRTQPHDRLCTLCKNEEIEDEEHFLLKCDIFNSLRKKYNFGKDENLNTLVSIDG